MIHLLLSLAIPVMAQTKEPIQSNRNSYNQTRLDSLDVSVRSLRMGRSTITSFITDRGSITFATQGRGIAWADGSVTTSAVTSALTGAFVQKAGDTMTGSLTVNSGIAISTRNNGGYSLANTQTGDNWFLWSDGSPGLHLGYTAAGTTHINMSRSDLGVSLGGSLTAPGPMTVNSGSMTVVGGVEISTRNNGGIHIQNSQTGDDWEFSVNSSTGMNIGYFNSLPLITLSRSAVSVSVAPHGTVSLGIPQISGTQLFYCNGGVNVGIICRGSGCPCAGGTETGLGIYVP